MKKSFYLISHPVADGVSLNYCSVSNRFLLLSKRNQETFWNSDPGEIKASNPRLYETLAANGFLVPDEADECGTVLERKRKAVLDRSWYNVVVNTTLDCNLRCWYCYESRIPESRMSPELIRSIKFHIASKHEETAYSCLKLSFFGGEPFLEFTAIRELLDFAKGFCRERGIALIADFTTNATLIGEREAEYLSRFRCHFQITLDGAEDTHNRIKAGPTCPSPYRRTLEALKLINEGIPDRLVAVRINFDNRVLREMHRIISDIDFLDRRKTYVIVKKVWQVGSEKIDREALMDGIQELLDRKFLPDYYSMPKGGVCFAEREQQTLFNYDGGVFKCTTISAFDQENSLGSLNFATGSVVWDAEKTRSWHAEASPDHCKACGWFGACLGPCNRQLLAHPGERLCTFDAMSLSEAEYLVYLFKYNLLWNELFPATEHATKKQTQ